MISKIVYSKVEASDEVRDENDIVIQPAVTEQYFQASLETYADNDDPSKTINRIVKKVEIDKDSSLEDMAEKKADLERRISELESL